MPRLSKDALGDLVYDQIVLMLLNKDLKPGDKLQKKELAEILGVSITPVSEALNRLIREGIVEQREKRDLFIRVFTTADMVELFEVRAGLEGTALHICMEKLNDREWEPLLALFDGFDIPVAEDRYEEYQLKDREFHSSLLKLSRNNLIQEFIDRCDFILRCYSRGLIREPDETLPEHRRIIEAIRSKNADLAQRMIMEHHWRTREKLGKSL
ncbi:GntR family transcriptional regulator [Spirochaeta isovalerica]|uniref:DNA-binding GntR family transcriptional regulator n=1 Tax=Spirochaeta isovalerica TaxID=150 RepID=A0A841R6Z2_9SPIO|nr:GntR family transcriptional regulator [Spirochaeta isovalerica]MBB6479606.1 DNA-binding GntR family transcriptional regulator [Spirochaeta isovalerica]